MTIPDEFPVSKGLLLAAHLADGTLFSHQFIGVRDPQSGDGVEIFQCFWIPDNVPVEVVEGLRAHIMFEFSDSLRPAYKKATRVSVLRPESAVYFRRSKRTYLVNAGKDGNPAH
ncbi:hypothetical protein F5Y10DRAFT_214948 [Nemania abortiva]|nr:hypothetical protein F5Y10DRAFT_214948 [Nemania abortiva]